MNPKATAIKEIESSHNPAFKELVDIFQGKRKKEGLFLVEGPDMVDEAMKANALVTMIATDGKLLKKGVNGIILSPKLVDRISAYKSPSQVLGVAKIALSQDPGPACLYLDNVQDPGNVGTLIRTALSFGFSSVFLSQDSASLANPKTIQSTKGAIFRIKTGYMDLPVLKEKGYHLYLTTLDGQDESTVKSLTSPFALVLGNEGRGIPLKHQSLGEKIRIRMGDFDSLNVAIAGGIFMYRFRQN